MDKKINKKGKLIINGLKERGWIILNGSYEEERGWTFIGRAGTSVIDHVVINVKAWEEIKKVKEGNRTESEHIPLEVKMEGPVKRGKREERREIERSVWTEEGIKQYLGIVKDGYARKKRQKRFGEN